MQIETNQTSIILIRCIKRMNNVNNFTETIIYDALIHRNEKCLIREQYDRVE